MVEATAPEDQPRGARVVVVGNGMVGHRLCEKLVGLDPGRRIRLAVIGEEPRAAYDRVHLTDYFAARSAEALALAPAGWYEAHGIDRRLGARVTRIDRPARRVTTDRGESIPYDHLVLATGSAPFVPPVPGTAKRGVFVYRTIDDLEAILRHLGARTEASGPRAAVVIGGGLLGLEAARALLEAGNETHVVEVAPRLMPRQLDDTGAALLAATVRGLGVHVHLDARVTRVVGDLSAQGIELADGRVIPADTVVISAGIRPRDELARDAGLTVGARGGVVVDDRLRTSDDAISAIGEVALHRGMVHGLVAPGYEMAEVVAKTLAGQPATFVGADASAKLKLLGADVATFGVAHDDPAAARVVVHEDQVRGTYRKLLFSRDGKHLEGGVLVGDTSGYAELLHLARSRATLSDDLREVSPAANGAAHARLPDEAQVCSCNNVAAGALREAVRAGTATTVQDLKACTRAGTGCGGCLPVVSGLLEKELAACGKSLKKRLCEHFAFTRRELFEIVAATRVRTFAELARSHGRGHGCEICKPTVASILASVHNEPILDAKHRALQDSNDRFLANIQKNGTYSVVPRVPAGEITPDQLIALGQVAKRYSLYTKITGGQRVDLFGARVEQLPDIWEELIAAGFESGHAYGKAVRTVKSCVGSTWCRYGVQDSTAFAIRVENRYKGIRAPHKLKAAVSGCVRECAEAQSKDFGLIATERGWNVYVGGNGGARPRHADLLAVDVSEEDAVRYLDRFIMFYIRTADRLTRTSTWIESLEGGVEHLRDVIVRDSLGVGAELEREMEALVGSYACEWRDVVNDPEKRATFRHFANDAEGDDTIAFAEERGQPRPAPASVRRLPVVRREWVRLAAVSELPEDGGVAFKYGGAQIAVYRVASRGELYATDNMCPHSGEMVLARGIVGDQSGRPKVACPLHKKTFDLETGGCLSGEPLQIATFDVRVEGDDVWALLPPVSEVARCRAAS